jgi:release factor glutamine methyltransferase
VVAKLKDPPRPSAKPAAGSLGAWRRDARARLKTSGVERPDVDADLIAAHVLGISRIELIVQSDRTLTSPQKRRLVQLLERRCERVPMQYLLEDVEFSGLRLEVRPGVFIPRPETEGLVERVLALLPREPGWVADIGTGTGAIALALATARPDLRIVATDISTDAIRQARRNAARLGLAKRVTFMRGDLIGPLEPKWKDELLAVVSNPPYIAFAERKLLAPDVVDHEPHQALFAREHGLAAIRRLAENAARFLRPGGFLALEIGEGQRDRVARTLHRAEHWAEIRIERDLAGKDRYALAQLRVKES